MESSGKSSRSLPTILGNASVCVFHLCLPCTLSPTQDPSQLYVTHEGYSGVLEVIGDSSLWNEWLTKKDIQGAEQHTQFLSFEKEKCLGRNGPQWPTWQMWVCPSVITGIRRRRRGIAKRLSLPKVRGCNPRPAQIWWRKGLIIRRQHVLCTVSQALS